MGLRLRRRQHSNLSSSSVVRIHTYVCTHTGIVFENSCSVEIETNGLSALVFPD